MITIKEIANMLGISTTTVSNVIHGKTGEVSPSTVERVKKMLVEYDYVPNINARNLAQNKSKIIGLAMMSRKDKYENMIKDPFAGELIGAIENAIRANGYYMMIYISDMLNEIMTCVSQWNADGLILLGMRGDDCILLKKRFHKPMVFIDGYFVDGIADCVNIGLADAKGGYDMTRYLIAKGHRRIAFVADNCVGVDYERFMGYRKATREAGLEQREEDLIMIRPAEDEIETSLAEIYRMSENYTALFCASDYYAAMLLNYLCDHGKRVPEDISIVGYDDNLYSRIVRPAITTVHQDVTQKGILAVDNLVSQLRGQVAAEKKIKLGVDLVFRDSVQNVE